MSDQQSGEWWAVITHAFQAHERDEQHFLDAYEELCLSVADPGMRFLIELILEDERRHHGLFERMAAAARGDDPTATPGPPVLSAEDAHKLLEPTERFLDAELEDRKHLKDLAKQLKPARDDTLWHLLIELMELDTAKHVKILEYVRDHVREAAKHG